MRLVVFTSHTGIRPPPASVGDAVRNTAHGQRESTVRYSESFREAMVEKMAGPNGRSASVLSQEVGISQPTLSRWLREAGTSRVPPVSKKKKSKTQRSSSEVARAKRPQDWKPAEKLQVVLEAAELSDAELGEFLRKKGLHEAQLEEWRRLATEALSPQPRTKKPSPEAARIRELEKELRRKEKALAEAAALIVLQKKARAIWGDGGDDTDPTSGG